MPEEVAAQARKELRRLQRTPEAAAEYGMIRAYLDWLIELPWAPPAPPAIDIAEARRILDEDHYGLEKIKTRILEYLAVRKLAPEGKAPILCFVGPPGVGKTSLGQSIARAISGPSSASASAACTTRPRSAATGAPMSARCPATSSRRSARPARATASMMLDEIDKMGAGIQGDPSAAMLEVLDPEQNATFRDNYLAVPFDLSRVVFIATANMLDTIPGPLRDRMEIIALSGYTAGEKLEIAKRYLVRRQLEANGLKPDQVEIDDDALARIIAGLHPRGRRALAGARDRPRPAQRRHADRRGQGRPRSTSPRPTSSRCSGPPRFENEVAMRTAVPGVATGPRLDAGRRRHPVHRGGQDAGQRQADPHRPARRGDARKRPGGAQPGQDPAPPTWGSTQASFEKSDIHVHVPAGATPKDGPSAGRGDVHRPGLAAHRPHGAQRHGHDRRDQPARPRPAGRRHQGEGGRRRRPPASRASCCRPATAATTTRSPQEVRDKLEFVWLERVEDAVAAALAPAA